MLEKEVLRGNTDFPESLIRDLNLVRYGLRLSHRGLFNGLFWFGDDLGRSLRLAHEHIGKANGAEEHHE